MSPFLYFWANVVPTIRSLAIYMSDTQFRICSFLASVMLGEGQVCYIPEHCYNEFGSQDRRKLF